MSSDTVFGLWVLAVLIALFVGGSVLRRKPSVILQQIGGGMHLAGWISVVGIVLCMLDPLIG